MNHDTYYVVLHLLKDDIVKFDLARSQKQVFHYWFILYYNVCSNKIITIRKLMLSLNKMILFIFI